MSDKEREQAEDAARRAEEAATRAEKAAKRLEKDAGPPLRDIDEGGPGDRGGSTED